MAKQSFNKETNNINFKNTKQLKTDILINNKLININEPINISDNSDSQISEIYEYFKINKN